LGGCIAEGQPLDILDVKRFDLVARRKAKLATCAAQVGTSDGITCFELQGVRTAYESKNQEGSD
jgi:hypothetical protein